MLNAKGNLKKNDKLFPWLNSIVNYFWWSSTTCEKNLAILKEKWLSVTDHIANEHESENNEFYHVCAHGLLGSEEERMKRWLPKGYYAHEALEEVVRDKNILKDLPYLVEFKHSGASEFYHNRTLMYCTKRIH